LQENGIIVTVSAAASPIIFASARADTARIVSDAEGYANDAIPKASGQARQMLEETEAYKRKKSDRGRMRQSRPGDRPAFVPGNHGAGFAADRKADCGQQRQPGPDHSSQGRPAAKARAVAWKAGWRLPEARAEQSPQDAIYAMLDAARTAT
jgi:hypothetical protein